MDIYHVANFYQFIIHEEIILYTCMVCRRNVINREKREKSSQINRGTLHKRFRIMISKTFA